MGKKGVKNTRKMCWIFFNTLVTNSAHWRVFTPKVKKKDLIFFVILFIFLYPNFPKNSHFPYFFPFPFSRTAQQKNHLFNGGFIAKKRTKGTWKSRKRKRVYPIECGLEKMKEQKWRRIQYRKRQLGEKKKNS